MALATDPGLPTSLQEAVDRLEDPRAALVAIVDRAVRLSRKDDYCATFEAIMEVAVPELLVSTAYDRRMGGAGSTWVDTDGVSCSGYDREGYNDRGFHWNTGLDRQGFDQSGVNPNDPTTKYRFDHWGMDADGFNTEGLRGYYQNTSTMTRVRLFKARAEHEFVYDCNGYRNPEVPVASE